MQAGGGAPMHSKNDQGFTTTELMLALAIIGLLLAMAIPAIGGFVASGRRAEITNDLLLAMKTARSESEKRVLPVTVCASSDQASCAGSGKAFDSGWVLFVDVDDDGEIDAGETVLAHAGYQGTPSHTVYSTRSRFTFRPFGASATNGSIYVCDDRGAAHSRAVVIALSGRARVETPSSC